MSNADSATGFYEAWLGRYRPSTQRAYRLAHRRLQAWCEQQGLDPWEPTSEAVARFVADQSGRRADASVDQLRAAMNSLIKHCRPEGADIALPRPRQTPAPPRIVARPHVFPLSLSQVVDLLDAAEDLGPQSSAFIGVLVETGASRTQLPALRSQDLRWLAPEQTPCVVLQDKLKSKRRHAYPLSVSTAEALMHIRPKDHAAPVFVGSRRGNPLDPRATKNRFDEIRRHAGLSQSATVIRARAVATARFALLRQHLNIAPNEELEYREINARRSAALEPDQLADGQIQDTSALEFWTALYALHADDSPLEAMRLST